MPAVLVAKPRCNLKKEYYVDNPVPLYPENGYRRSCRSWHAEPSTMGFSEVKSIRISAIQAPPPTSQSEHDIPRHYRNSRSFIFLVAAPLHKIYIRDLLRIEEEALEILKMAECPRNLKKKFKLRNSFCRGV